MPITPLTQSPPESSDESLSDAAIEARRVIDALGGTFAVAALMEIKPPSVSEWRNSGIPRARRQTLRLLRPDLFEDVGDSESSEAA